MKGWRWFAYPVAGLGLLIMFHDAIVTSGAWDIRHSLLAGIVIAAICTGLFVWFREGNEGFKSRWRVMRDYQPSSHYLRLGFLFWLVVLIALMIFFNLLRA